MLNKTCFVLWIGSIVAAATPSFAQEPAPAKPPAVLEYLARRASQMAAQLPPVADSAAAWEKQRGELLGELGATLGLPQREPMKAGVTYSKEEGDLVIEEVAYLWGENAYVAATVIRSKTAKGRQPAVVMPSGWLGHYTFLPYRKCVDALARSGCVVLSIDDPRTGRRQAPFAGLYAVASASGTQPIGIQVFDALRGLDYLMTRGDVDPGKIGIAGLGEGAVQAWLAAALEPRFQFVVAVGGTTTYEALIQAQAGGAAGPDDPSAFVGCLLRFADLDRVAACAAPRPVLVAGTPGAKFAGTLQAVYKLCDAADRISLLPGERADTMSPYAEQIAAWVGEQVKTLKDSGAPPQPCATPEEPDFDMVACFQRRIAAGAESLPAKLASEAAWQAHRAEIVKWLGGACGLDGMKPGPDKVVKTSEADDTVTEQLQLGIDGDFTCPAVLVRPAASGGKKLPAVILSHDDRQCATSAKIVAAAGQLAASGYCVIVPDHASANSQSGQPLGAAGEPSFYGDEAAGFYGPADAVGLPPLALRVADDLAAFRCLAARPEVDPAKIAIAGLGTGGIDACLAAVLEQRIAGVASIDATALRDWATTSAPGALRFFHVMPYLPSLATKTDLDCLYGAIAPRPLVLVRLKDGWPKTGFEQVAATASAVYKLQKADGVLLTLGPRDATEQLQQKTPEGVQKQLVAAARALVPAPPTPGIVGNLEGLKSRATTDSAAGLIWVAAELGGYEQEFAAPGFQLKTWSFFNDNGAGQKDYVITPLLFKKEGERYKLTGVGTTRTNAGTGLQTFPFESVEGTDEVGDDYFFGWHTGDGKGKQNAGVVEFEDAPDCRMVILTGDGAMEGQKLKVGAGYRLQSQYPRRYSIMATAKGK